MSTEFKEPTWTSMFDFGKVRNADGKVLIGVAVVALFFDAAVRSGFVSTGGALLALAAPIALVASGRFRRIESVVFLAAVPFFGIWLAVRSSPWLIGLDVIAACILLLFAASFARGGSLFNVTITDLIVRACAACVHAVYAGPFFVRGLMTGKGRRVGPVVRGLSIVAPVVVVLAALLASADTVFASLFDFGDLPLHLFLIAIGAWLVTILFSMASAESPDSSPGGSHPFGATEALVALGAVVALFTAFVITQIVVLTGGADHVLETNGLTYADHARQGFFQLIAVTVITLGLLMLLKSVTKIETPSQRRWFIGLAEVAVVLTLVIVISAISRLALYEDAYGLTMLRLYSTVFAGWIGVVFILMGASLAGLAAHKHWFIGASVSLGLVIVFAMNIVNPEQLVVKRNVAHAKTSSVPFDPHYNGSLSADASKELWSSVSELDEPAQRAVRFQLCNANDPDFFGWLATNLSRDNAKDRRDINCRVAAP